MKYEFYRVPSSINADTHTQIPGIIREMNVNFHNLPGKFVSDVALGLLVVL